jgi:hypothetical protein
MARAAGHHRLSMLNPVSPVRPELGLSGSPPHDGNGCHRFHLSVFATDECPPALMHQPVVAMTQENEVVEISRSHREPSA